MMSFRPLRRLSLVLAGVLASCSLVLAATESNIMGKWCGTESSYAIDPKSMVVTRHSDSAQLVFEVVKIESREKSVLIQWRLQGRVGGTEFGEFSTDGLKMAQLANAKGPRRDFRRC